MDLDRSWKHSLYCPQWVMGLGYIFHPYFPQDIAVTILVIPTTSQPPWIEASLSGFCSMATNRFLAFDLWSEATRGQATVILCVESCRGKKRLSACGKELVSNLPSSEGWQLASRHFPLRSHLSSNTFLRSCWKTQMLGYWYLWKRPVLL